METNKKTINLNGAGTSSTQVLESINENATILSFAGASDEAIDIRATSGSIISDIALGGADPTGNTAGLMIVADKVKLDALPKNELYELAVTATAVDKYYELGQIVLPGSYRWLNFKVVIESRICSAEFFLSVESKANNSLVEMRIEAYALGSSAMCVTHDNLGNVKLYMLIRAWSPDIKISMKEVSKNSSVSYSLGFDPTAHDSDIIGSVRPIDGNPEFIFKAIT